MPNPGQANNPSGENSFNHFAPEEPYGQATKDASLAAAAPLAGQKLSVGAIAAPKQAQRPAQAAPQTQATMPLQEPAAQTQVSPLAQVWAAVAADPEASPLVREYAARAQ